MVNGLNGLAGAYVKQMANQGARRRERGSVQPLVLHVVELTVREKMKRAIHVPRMEDGVTGLHGVDVVWELEEVKQELGPAIILFHVVEEMIARVQMKNRDAAPWIVCGVPGLLQVPVTRPREPRYLAESPAVLLQPAMGFSALDPASM